MVPISYNAFIVIPFTRNFLLEYTKMLPTPLEVIESVDMMRIIENGLKVKMVPTMHQTYAVDTLDDLKKIIIACLFMLASTQFTSVVIAQCDDVTFESLTKPGPF